MRLLASIALVWIWLHGYLFAQGGTTDSQCHSCITATALNGEFFGMDEIKNYEPGKMWFHENSLLIRDNEALLDKVPLKIVKGRKNYSASDGGFITYRGRFFDRDKDLFISLRPFDSDYIAFPIGGCEPYSKVTVFPVKVTSRGIEIDGVLYHTMPQRSRGKHDSTYPLCCATSLLNIRAYDHIDPTLNVLPASSECWR